MTKADETSHNAATGASQPDELAAARDVRTLVAFLDSIIDNIPATIFVKDASTLRYERFNRAAEELTGLTREDFHVFEDGAEQQITSLTVEDSGLAGETSAPASVPRNGRSQRKDSEPVVSRAPQIRRPR